MTRHATTHAQQQTTATTNVVSGVLQRKCACGTHTITGSECSSCQKEKASTNLQRAATSAEPVNEVPSIVDEVLRSSGQPLDVQTRSFFEPRFGHDFSRVRVHTDARAAESARAVNALAYTVGQDVVFGAGQYRPEASLGCQLLGHELTHVIQQSGDSSIANLSLSKHTDSLEQEAKQTETVITQNTPQPSITIRSGNKVSLQRQPAQKQPRTDFDNCDPALQNDLRAKHAPALQHVELAIASLAPGWAKMDPVHQASFRQFFDPANSNDIDAGFVRDVRSNYRRIRDYMGSLRFDCDPHAVALCGTQEYRCRGGRLMWTCFGNLHVCTDAYPSASDPFKIETIIHESVHNALLTTDRAYSNESDFKSLRPRGGGFLGGLLNLLNNIPVLGILFRALPGNNDTINNPDSYAGYAMRV
jgi:hypothetical protein